VSPKDAEEILQRYWHKYLKELAAAERQSQRLLPGARAEEAARLDLLMITVQGEVRRRGGPLASPVRVASGLMERIERLSDPNVATRLGVEETLVPLTSAGFAAPSLRPALVALRGAMSGWTDSRTAALFKEYLKQAVPEQKVVRGLQTVLELPEIGEQFKQARALVDWLLDKRRARGHRDLVGEGVIAAAIADYAAAVWLRRTFEAVVAFVIAERTRGDQALMG